jgi:hypothetical protein
MPAQASEQPWRSWGSRRIGSSGTRQVRYFDRAVGNLRQAVDEIVTQESARTPAGWLVQFRDLLSRAESARVPLAVVGGAALAIRGIDVCPGDIDVLTTLEGADALAESYQDELVVPLFTSRSGSRVGRGPRLSCG